MAGGVPALVGGLIYVGKKAVDIGADIVKARLLKDNPKEFTVIYGPDGRVARRVELDS